MHRAAIFAPAAAWPASLLQRLTSSPAKPVPVAAPTAPHATAPPQRRRGRDRPRAGGKAVTAITDISPESPPTPSASIAAPDPGGPPEAPQRTSQLRQHPLLRVAAAVAGLTLSWGAFQVTHTLRAGCHDNTPISTSSQAPPGALTVPGAGFTLTFPAGWDQRAGVHAGQRGQILHLRAAPKKPTRKHAEDASLQSGAGRRAPSRATARSGGGAGAA